MTEAIWENGALREWADVATRLRVALGTLACPMACCIDTRPTSIAVATSELEHAQRDLMYGGVASGDLERDVGRIVAAQQGPCVVVLIPAEMPITGTSRWEECAVAAWRVESPASTKAFTASHYRHAINEHGPAVNLRLSADGESRLATSWANRANVDLPIRTNHAGQVARAGRWTIAVQRSGSIWTPPLRDGAFFDGWRERLIGRTLDERPITLEHLRSSPAACITGWGTAHPLLLGGGPSLDATHDLTLELNASLEAERSK